MSQQILFKNFELLKLSFGELRGEYRLQIEGDTVKELSQTPIKAPDATVIDCGKHTLMPGLIDCHPQRGQCPPHGDAAADPGHRARSDAVARHAGPRFHDRA